MRRRPLRDYPLLVVLRPRVASDRAPLSIWMSDDKISLSCEEEIMHDLWVERELRITAVDPTFLLIAWVCVPAWSLWQAFGPQGVKNTEEGLVFPPLTTFASPILLLSLLTTFVASAISVLSQIFLPTAIRNTPPNELAKRKIQQTMRIKTMVAYFLQMTSCVLYQAVVSCSWVLDRSFSMLDFAPLVYMFAVTGIMWSTLILSPSHSSSI